MKRGQKMKYKTIFFQDWGTFNGTTLVCVGWKNYAEIKEHLKKRKHWDWYNAMHHKPDEFDSHHFSKWKYKNRRFSLLFLKDYKPKFDYYNILSHELVHAVMFMMSDYLEVEEESEAVAYQHTYLMREIVKKLTP